MNCRHARSLIHELLDGTLDDRSALDEHISTCEECRTHYDTLTAVAAAVQASVDVTPDEARLAALTSEVERTLRVAPLGATFRPSFARAPLAAAAAALVFALGLFAGRGLWPRETTRTEIVERPKVIERVVEVPKEVRVEVPVIQERVVIRRVPVVQTRVVYRDREVPAPTPPGTVVIHESPGGPVKADEVVIRLASHPADVSAVISTEFHPVTIVEPEERPEESGDVGQDPTGERDAVRTVRAVLADSVVATASVEGS